MAKFELPIYGENDEIEVLHESNVCPWEVFIRAADIEEKLPKMSAKEQLEAVGDLVKAVFAGLTDAQLKRADALDVMNTFQQITRGGQKIRRASGAGAERKN